MRNNYQNATLPGLLRGYRGKIKKFNAVKYGGHYYIALRS